MSTLATSPSSMEAGAISSFRNRPLTILVAFWHTLRRDIIVTSREIMPLIMQVVVQPLCLLFVFGKVLPNVGVAQPLYPALFLPGVVALNINLVAIVGMTLTLILDLGSTREIEDRLLAPLPTGLVAVEKVIFAALRALVAGLVTFPLAYWILGNGYQVRTDMLVPLLGIMLLSALASSALGLVIGTILAADKIYLLFTLVFSALMYTGCVYYSWSSLSSLKALQIVTLFNPLTYGAEGLRYTMVPMLHGQTFSTLPIGWAVLGLIVSFVLFLVIGLWTFHKRVIS